MKKKKNFAVRMQVIIIGNNFSTLDENSETLFKQRSKNRKRYLWEQVKQK